jgi:hypothetical protein
MPMPVGNLLSEITAIKKAIRPIKTEIYGDRARSSREMETIPSVYSRLGTVEYTIWGSTSDVPKSCKDQIAIVEKKIAEILPQIKELSTKMSAINESLSRNKAPYSDGRNPR